MNPATAPEPSGLKAPKQGTWEGKTEVPLVYLSLFDNPYYGHEVLGVERPSGQLAHRILLFRIQEIRGSSLHILFVKNNNILHK